MRVVRLLATTFSPQALATPLASATNRPEVSPASTAIFSSPRCSRMAEACWARMADSLAARPSLRLRRAVMER